jgi:formate hydrogenlyase subunit 3/multisubunit Na+/H+ antiporter MnhD subunit
MAELVELARTHGALLALLAPLFGACAAIATPVPRLSWALGAVAMIVGAGFAVDMALRMTASDAAVAVPLEGIPLHVDPLNAFAVAVVSVCGALTLIAAGASLQSLNPRAAPFAVALSLLACAGWIGALFASDLVGVLVSAEAALLASAGLLALGGERSVSNGAMRLLAAGGVGGALAFLGAAFVFAGAGSLDLTALAHAMPGRTALVSVGFGLLLVALFLKAGIAPLHAWVGASFGRADGFAALMLGVVGCVGALTVALRLAVHAVPDPAMGAGLSTALSLLGGVSILVGSLQAIGARNVRRMTAYAGVAQAGSVLVCVALGSPAGFAAALVQLIAMAATALALYGGAAASQAYAITALDGLARRAPLAGLAMTFGAVNLIGAPLTIGFLGRWRLIEAGVGVDWWWAVGAMTFASLAAVLYCGSLIERIYFRRAQAVMETPDPWRVAYYPALIAAILTIAIGVAPVWLLRAADVAAMMGAAG